jgi:transcription termination factor Rho
MYSKEELMSKPVEELETIAKALGSDLSAADGAEALADFIIGDFPQEEEKPKKKRATAKKAETPESEEPAVKKKRGRPSKADLAARAAEEALKNLSNADNESTEKPEELAINFTEESSKEENTTAADASVSAATEASADNAESATDELAPKKKRARRSKEEIFAAAQAKAAALAANNQKKHELETFTETGAVPANNAEIPDFLINDNNANDDIPEGEMPEGEDMASGNLLSQFQEKVNAHNASGDAWEGDPGDGTDFIVVLDLPVEDHYASVSYDMLDNPTTIVEQVAPQSMLRPATPQEEKYDFTDIISANGVLEVMPDGYGFLRSSDFNYLSSPDDIFLTVQQIKKYSLKTGDVVQCRVRPPREGEKYFPMTSIEMINGRMPNEIRDRLSFEHLTPLFPDEKFNLTGDRRTTNISTRIVDLFSPIGKGQRALIVAQPKTGKTILMKDIANAIAANHPEAYLMMLLIDERPEEVTDMARTVNAEVIASTFDEPAERHVKIAGIVLEKAKRMVECGHDVVIFLDSITRLARAYNTVAPASGKVLTGGVDANALQKPKRFFGAARNIEGGGSLTIIATALIDTGSKMDEVIFEEFKGTGNMELQLDRSLANKRIFPAVNLVQSSTRRDDLLHDKTTLDRMWILRKHISDMNAIEAMNMIGDLMKRTNSNEEFLIGMNG